jgi:hypothetical protein
MALLDQKSAIFLLYTVIDININTLRQLSVWLTKRRTTMQRNRALEEILDLLLNEENEQAEQLFHDYLVGKAREEYQRQLDEADAEGNEDANFEEEGDEEEGDEEEGDEEEADAEGDIEDRVDDIEQDIADLQAEFEKLLAGDEAADEFADFEDGDVIDQGGSMEDDVLAFDDEGLGGEYNSELDGALEEATKLQDKVSKPKDGNSDADGKPSPLSTAPKKADWNKGVSPVKVKAGGDGKATHGGSVKHNTQTNRTRDVDVEKKAGRQPMTRGKAD